VLDNEHIHPVDDFFGQIGEDETAKAIPLDNGGMRVETSPLELRNSVFNDEFCEALRRALSVVSGTSLTDFSSQKEMAEAIADLTNAGRWRLTYNGMAVKLRAINPKRTKVGYFQLRALGSKQSSIYTGKVFPELVIEMA